jgi:hypothetical protein
MAKKFLGKTPEKIDFRSQVDSAEEFVTSGKWVLVKSSNVKRIVYNRHVQELRVEFLSGAIYRYDGVPKRIAKEMFTASSLGRYVWQRLRGKYPYTMLKAGRQGEKDRS